MHIYDLGRLNIPGFSICIHRPSNIADFKAILRDRLIGKTPYHILVSGFQIPLFARP